MDQVISSLNSIDKLIFMNREAFLLLLVIIPILILFLISSYRRDQKTLHVFKSSANAMYVKYIILGLAYAMIFFGIVGTLAQPRLEKFSSSELLVDGEFIVLIDVSMSSNARATPSSKTQLDLSKNVVVEILDKLGNSKIQIFAYTSIVLPVSDFTEDRQHILDTLEHSVYREVTTIAGSDLPNALAGIARKKIEDPRYSNVSHIILLTDGQISVPAANVNDFPTALKMLEDNNLSIISVGVGSVVGWRIPVFNREGTFTGKYMRTRKGYFVSVLNESNLKILSERTGGRYFYYEDIDRLKIYFEDIAIAEGMQSHQSGRNVFESKDVSWIFLSVSFIGLLILAFYRKLI